jgi:L-aspartate oxidase
VRGSAAIEVAEHVEVLELLVRNGGVEGVLARDGAGDLVRIDAAAVLLATGGAGRAYLKTTSPPGLNGDGLAMAAFAGARLMDLEFVQFHPTALNVHADPLPLMTEALRGAGARLVNQRGEPVLDPDEGDELASRDKVARALWARIREGIPVFLDCRKAFGGKVAEAFPGVHALCRAHGVDPDSELVPVTPAAHYHMGGIAVDEDGRSSLRGLWAAGEASASGVHGANRLASNSLLEGLVFGPRAARSMARAIAQSFGPQGTRSDPPISGSMGTFDAPPLAPEVVLRIRTILWEQVGVIRSAAGLESALAELDALEEKLRRLSTPPVRPLLLVARLITRTALLRTESRGCHFRTDFPEPDPGAPRHSQVEVGTDGLAIRAFLAEAPTEPTPPAEVSSPA